jgi:HD-like signal output (HDOD) protein
MEIFEAMHVEQGFRLVQHWNFPAMYCDVIKSHHADVWDPVNKMLAIVRFVNMSCHRVGLGLKHEPDLALLDTREADVLDIGELQIVQLLSLLEETRNAEI